jgi:hypothetical protein
MQFTLVVGLAEYAPAAKPLLSGLYRPSVYGVYLDLSEDLSLKSNLDLANSVVYLAATHRMRVQVISRGTGTRDIDQNLGTLLLIRTQQRCWISAHNHTT